MFLLSLYDHRCWRFVAYLLRQFVRMFVILIKSHSCIPLFCLSSVFLFSFSQELVPDGTVFGKARLRGRTDTAASPGGRRASFRAFLLELLCQARHKRGCRKNEDRFCLWR